MTKASAVELQQNEIDLRRDKALLRALTTPPLKTPVKGKPKAEKSQSRED